MYVITVYRLEGTSTQQVRDEQVREAFARLVEHLRYGEAVTVEAIA